MTNMILMMMTKKRKSDAVGLSSLELDSLSDGGVDDFKIPDSLKKRSIKSNKERIVQPNDFMKDSSTNDSDDSMDDEKIAAKLLQKSRKQEQAKLLKAKKGRGHNGGIVGASISDTDVGGAPVREVANPKTIAEAMAAHKEANVIIAYLIVAISNAEETLPLTIHHRSAVGNQTGRKNRGAAGADKMYFSDEMNKVKAISSVVTELAFSLETELRGAIQRS